VNRQECSLASREEKTLRLLQNQKGEENMAKLKEVVVIDAIRSPIGRSGRKGMEKGVSFARPLRRKGSLKKGGIPVNSWTAPARSA